MPTSVTAVSHNAKIYISFTDESGGTKQHVIDRSETEEGQYSLVALLQAPPASGEMPVEDDGVETSETYWYRVSEVAGTDMFGQPILENTTAPISIFVAPAAGHVKSQFRALSAGGATLYDSGEVDATEGPWPATGLPKGVARPQARYRNESRWSAWGEGTAVTIPGSPPTTPTVSAESVTQHTAVISQSAFSDPDGGDVHTFSQFRVWSAGMGIVVFDSLQVGPVLTWPATGLTPDTMGYIPAARRSDGTLWSEWGFGMTFNTSAVPAYSPDVTFTVGMTAAQVQSAVSGAPVNTKFLFGGTAGQRHYEMEFTPKDGQEFRAATGVGVYGSRLLTSFTTEGSLRYASGQTQGGDSLFQSEAKASQPRAGHPEELFINGVPLQHVSTKAAVSAGKWWFDYPNDRIYFADDPTGKTVTTSVKRNGIKGLAANVKIRDMDLHEYANHAQQGVIHAESGNARAIGWIIEGVTVGYCHGTGIRSCPFMKIRASTIRNTGQLGIGGGSHTTGWAEGIVVEDNEIHHNNRLFQWVWEGGGTKFVHTRDMIFRNNYSHHNDGPGYWCDIANRDPEIYGNTIEDNNGPGIMLEIGYGGHVHDNTVKRNALTVGAHFGGAAGIFISATNDVEVNNNVVEDNRGGILAIQQNRGSGPLGVYQVTDLYVHHNTIKWATFFTGISADPGGLAVNPNVYTSANNLFANNTYRIPSTGAARFEFSNGNRTYAQWLTYGHDTGSTLVVES